MGYLQIWVEEVEKLWGAGTPSTHIPKLKLWEAGTPSTHNRPLTPTGSQPAKVR
jgi:hypothetical protein